MAGYLLAVYIHLMATVFWVGYTLFWIIMIGSLRQRFDSSESARLVSLLNQSTWPPVAIPTPYRLRFPGLGWAALAVLVVTGIFLLYSRGVTLQQIGSGELFVSAFGRMLAAKLILVIVLLICQLLLAARPVAWIISVTMLLTLVVVSLSVMVVR